jgi:K(+)-stimulated pyrophosphate-energized sodium pump
MGALYKGLIATGVLSIMRWAPPPRWGMAGADRRSPRPASPSPARNLFFCGDRPGRDRLIMVVITEYYTGTGYRPVARSARRRSPVTAPTSSRVWRSRWKRPRCRLIVIVGGIISTYQLAGLFGIAIAATTMLALAGIVVALDAFGPVTDNAGGIAEMAGLPRSPQHHRRARRRRQHHQGRHQGLRHRFRRSRCAGAVCGLHRTT